MNGKFKTIFALLTASMLVLACIFSVACTDKEENVWSLPSDNGTVKAYFSDNGKYGFVLNVEGDGEMSDFSSKKDAPWYGKSGRITEIRIADGVKKIGANAFTDVKVQTVIIPETVKTAGPNAFNPSAKLCVYKDTEIQGDAEVYFYSATSPKTNGKFWHLREGKAVIWQTRKVLFIGNSFTFYSDVPSIFGEIARSLDENVVVESVTKGSWTLSKFADENDEQGKIVHEKLASSDDYDVIVLQEQSTRPLDNYKGFLSAVKALKEKINATQKSCKIYLYATWGYKEGADVYKITVPEMEKRLLTAYENVASETGTLVSRVGSAFTKIYTERPEINLYFSDNKHPSYAGAYLSASVHVATILELDPRQSAYNGSLSENVASILKSVAYMTVFD